MQVSDLQQAGTNLSNSIIKRLYTGFEFEDVKSELCEYKARGYERTRPIRDDNRKHNGRKNHRKLNLILVRSVKSG